MQTGCYRGDNFPLLFKEIDMIKTEVKCENCKHEKPDGSCYYQCGNYEKFEPIINSDTIKNPSHYTSGRIECIDAIKSALTPEEFSGYIKGNVLKYIWRESKKNGIEDIKKAEQYIKWLIEVNK